MVGPAISDLFIYVFCIQTDRRNLCATIWIYIKRNNIYCSFSAQAIVDKKLGRLSPLMYVALLVS